MSNGATASVENFPAAGGIDIAPPPRIVERWASYDVGRSVFVERRYFIRAAHVGAKGPGVGQGGPPVAGYVGPAAAQRADAGLSSGPWPRLSGRAVWG